MTDLVVIVPSRSRPEQARSLIGAFRDTCTAATRLVFAIDADDPRGGDYADVLLEGAGLVEQPPGSMVSALNHAAGIQMGDDEPPFALGFMGDDHCPRSHGWDRAYLDALHELGTGIVYGNDLLQGEKIPTQVAITSDIVRALGFMAPPTLTHLYVDNFWKDLGQRAGCLRYLPEVIIEHRHPFAGKANWDAGYARVNDSTMYQRDQAAYGQYVAGQFLDDVAKVRRLRGER